MVFDRLQNGMRPGGAKACPTESIKFGYLDELQAVADKRLATLSQGGYKQAQLYGRDATVYGGLHPFFLLMNTPETYGLPSQGDATLPSRNNVPGYLGGAGTAIAGLVAGVVAVPRARIS